MNINELITLSILVESVGKIFKDCYNRDFFKPHIIFPFVIGILCALYTDINIFKLLNISVKMELDFIGNILTGIIISRGANFVHDILDSVKGLNLNFKDNLNN